ncbi:MAG TPA: COR domain-containing protein, partial [Gemmata sp.]
HLGWCTRVTDAGVKAVAEGLNLTTLDLWNCMQVTDAGVSAVAERLTHLTTLNLSYCRQVTDAGVSAVAERLTNLTTLNLMNCNKVKALPDSFGQLRALENLYLGGTCLTALPRALSELPRLRWLNVRNIPGLRLPEELIRNPENPRAILDYLFRTTSEGKRTLNEAKLILVGNEAVGKTSLVNFLVHKKPRRDSAKTPGVAIEPEVETAGWAPNAPDALVDVKRWKVHKAAAGDTPLKLNVWDFGGQQVLYETHQFFLTARSLYMVVLEARRENVNEQEANLHTWLRSIRTCTVKPVPVLVVINKSEPPHELRLDEAKLIREFPNIRGFIRTSCSDPKEDKHGGKGIDELRKTIVEVIRADLPHVKDELPLSYFTIKEKVARVARSSFILDTKSYRKTCATQKVTEEREQDNLLDLFDCIGLVVKYNETTLLDPNWLTTAVYSVLTHDDVTKAEGEFSRGDLGALLAGLPAADYPRERWPFIVEMMKRFGLCFELPNQPDRYLLPNQLPEVDPQPPWDDTDALRFRYSYRHTPPRGLLPRLIVQAHQHLTEPRVAWLLGVVLHIQGCDVLIRMNRLERRADISVRGPKNKRRDALAVVREYFAFVHGLNRFETATDFTPQVPVRVPGQPEAAFDFEELETDERNGVEKRWYKGHDTPFLVKELLAGVGREPAARGTRDEFGGSDWRFGGDIHIHGSVGSVGSGQFNNPQQKIRMGDNTTVNTGGRNITGAAIGAGAQVTAEKIISNVRQQLPESASRADVLAAVLKAALVQLAREDLKPKKRAEAEEMVGKIEKELKDPEPDPDLVKGWLGTIDAVSATASKILRDAGAIAALFG